MLTLLGQSLQPTLRALGRRAVVADERHHQHLRLRIVRQAVGFVIDARQRKVWSRSASGQRRGVRGRITRPPVRVG